MIEYFDDNVAKITIKNKNGKKVEFNCEGITINVNQSIDFLDFAEPRNYELEIINPNKTIYEREDNRMENTDFYYYYGQFTFPSNREKIYTYKIKNKIVKNLQRGKEYYILNDQGYNYKMTPVRFEGFVVKPEDIQLREIVAFWDEENPAYHSFYPLANEINYETWTQLQKMIVKFYDFSNDNLTESEGISEAELSEEEMPKIVNKLSEINKLNKGEDNMNSKIFNGIEFGKIEEQKVYAFTPKGIAYLSYNGNGEHGERSYVQYNPETNEIEDVSFLVLSNIDVSNFLYKIPVAISDVKIGDIVFSNSKPVFVREIKENNELVIIDPEIKTVETILLPKNVFGFNYITKVVNLMENFNFDLTASADQPFGNLLPLMMMSEGNNGIKDLLPFMFLSNGMGAGMNEELMKNPMMMYFLLRDGKGSDMLPFMLMNGANEDLMKNPLMMYFLLKDEDNLPF